MKRYKIFFFNKKYYIFNHAITSINIKKQIIITNNKKQGKFNFLKIKINFAKMMKKIDVSK